MATKRLVIKLKENVDAEVAVARLRRIPGVRSLERSIRPDPNLSSLWCYGEVEEAAASAVIEVLMADAAISMAYIKPADSPADQ